MSHYFCGEILIFSLSFITLYLTTCPLYWHYSQCSNFGKIYWYNASVTLELGVLHIALTHIWHFHLGCIFKNLYSVRELAKRVVTACKGSRDFQPLALSYTIRFPPSPHPSNTRSSSDQGLLGLFVQIL